MRAKDHCKSAGAKARTGLAYWRARRDTKDADFGHCGADKTARIDLGLALLEVLVKPGQRVELYDIAVWCGCTDSAIYLVQQRALRKLRNRLKFGEARSIGMELAS